MSHSPRQTEARPMAEDPVVRAIAAPVIQHLSAAMVVELGRGLVTLVTVRRTSTLSSLVGLTDPPSCPNGPKAAATYLQQKDDLKYPV